MKILFIGNNKLGWQVIKWLRKQQEEIVGLVLHPPQKRKFCAEILSACSLSSNRIFDGSKINYKETIQSVNLLKPDIGISVMFGYILKPELLSILPQGCINLHISYLPYNRGSFPNVWSIIDGTPAGVTLHYVDAGVDTGPIIAQRDVSVEPIDTGLSLYRKLERKAFYLFRDMWPRIKEGKTQRTAQLSSEGTYHRAQDVKKIDEIDLQKMYKAKNLLDILRARTFPPYPGVYFCINGKKVYLNLQLTYAEKSERTE
ncbi:MAG: formyltransferase family protein [Planctomycetota bacterium]